MEDAVRWEEQQEQKRLDRWARVGLVAIAVLTVVGCAAIWWLGRQFGPGSRNPSIEMGDVP